MKVNGAALVRLLFFLLIVAAAILAAIYKTEVLDAVLSFLEWVRSLGIYGPVVVVCAYIISCVFFVPGSLITIGSGFAFGLVLGTATVVVGSVTGAAAAFLVGRHLVRDAIERRIQNNPKFDVIAEAVKHKGFQIVLLTRLSPAIPFNLLNYAFGVTRVSFWKYVLASWIGMFPATVVFVYIGSTFKNLAELTADRETTLGERLLFWGGMAVAIVVTVFVTRIARKALQEAAPESATPNPSTTADVSIAPPNADGKESPARRDFAG